MRVKPKLKLIVITAVTTTAAWTIVFAGLFWWFARSPDDAERLLSEFHKKAGAIGGIGIPNNHSKPTTVVIEELRTNSETIDRVELTQRQLQPHTSILIGVREIYPTNSETNHGLQ
jgi:hypothetical protein